MSHSKASRYALYVALGMMIANYLTMPLSDPRFTPVEVQAACLLLVAIWFRIPGSGNET